MFVLLRPIFIFFQCFKHCEKFGLNFCFFYFSCPFNKISLLSALYWFPLNPLIDISSTKNKDFLNFFTELISNMNLNKNGIVGLSHFIFNKKSDRYDAQSKLLTTFYQYYCFYKYFFFF